MSSAISKHKVIKQSIYRSVFWLGYVMVIAATFIPFKEDLHEITFNIVTFKFHFDQILHSIVYLLICLYLPAGQYFGLTLFEDNSFKKFLILIMGLAIVTETIQLAVPYRAFNFFDLVANVVGIGLGLGIIYIVESVLKRL
jgi:glycopeptide antibiotics resistance protein